MALIDKPERARQLARAIASDLSLYQSEKIVAALQADNLFTALAEEIEEGRQLFKSRVTPELFASGVYERALVDVLIKAKGSVRCKAW